MGYMASSTKISLEIGLDIDMSALSSHLLDFDNLVYGVLQYKKPSRKAKRKKVVKHIQPKDYNVNKYLRKKFSWYWEDGYNTCGSKMTRAYIMETKSGTNYHKTASVTTIATK